MAFPAGAARPMLCPVEIQDDGFASCLGLGERISASPGLQLRMGIESESRRHGHRLTYLATPHHVRVRRLSSDIIMQPRAVNNVKVVLNLTSEKFPAVIRLIRHHRISLP